MYIHNSLFPINRLNYEPSSTTFHETFDICPTFVSINHGFPMVFPRFSPGLLIPGSSRQIAPAGAEAQRTHAPRRQGEGPTKNGRVRHV